MRDSRAAWIFVAPALGAIAAFLFVPVLASLALSFTDFDLYAVADLGSLRAIGTGNYEALLADPLFWRALRNTFVFAFLGGPLSVAVSLAAALLVNARLVRARGTFRTLLFLPVVTTLVAVAVVWRYLYHPRIGLVNGALGWLGIAPIDWLGDPRWALPALVVMAVWKGFGANMIIFVAGLQSIPARLYEAASLDGAGAWQQLRHVTLPQLAPTAFFVALMTMIGSLQLFAEPKGMRGRQATPLRVIGDHPKGGPVQLFDGKYGPYVSHNKVNATLPKGKNPAELFNEFEGKHTVKSGGSITLRSREILNADSITGIFNFNNNMTSNCAGQPAGCTVNTSTPHSFVHFTRQSSVSSQRSRRRCVSSEPTQMRSNCAAKGSRFRSTSE